jgi:hypothetical protein
LVHFYDLVIGNKYDRPYLAKLWGYKTFNAISRGVFSPQNQNILVFFITKNKQRSSTPYEDSIERDILFWEGEKEHGNDIRITQGKDEIHIFFRDKDHTDFTYEGRAVLQNYQLLSNRPSKFSFFLIDKKVSDDFLVSEIENEYHLDKTEKDAIIISRIGQGYYRKESLKLWETCCVTGFSKKEVLIASHIKPWKYSSNEERIDPYNSLLLVPTIDKLFDKGFLGFQPNGEIILSNRIHDYDWKKINISEKLKLRFVPEKTRPYLDYHREYLFDFIDAQ